MSSPPRTAVVHLVWGPAGRDPFEAFLASYERHAAGAEHELVLLYNGFAGVAAALAPYRERAADLGAREIVLAAPCLDLDAYRQAAARLRHERICLVNSYSTVTASGWLALLEAPLMDPAVGAVGATGSYASHLSFELFQLGLPTRYGDAFESRRAAREVMHDLSGARRPVSWRHWLYVLAMAARKRRGSQRFPAPHLRTNGVLVERTLFAEICTGPARTKWDTHLLESGRGSMTARLRARGRPPVVIDRRGVARPIARWHEGDVFMQSGQQDLLIRDNQTDTYAQAGARERAVLSALAWGPWARPR
ncbi:MAG TPA: hypothetical protein VHZ31_05860 [Solirubrobacteraceae bacterium]|nr:hypothetical protein [Solirubrobacteraceae bacterium]